MENIRIGNDINIQWRILRDGSPEKFEGKDVKVKVLSYRGEEQVVEYKIVGNVINIAFLGMNQKSLGAYTLLLVENDGKPNMATLDQIEAFRLVPHSIDVIENINPCNEIKVVSLSLESNFEIKHVVEVIDGLDSLTTNAALSANQGRILNEKITQVEKKIPIKVSSLPNDVNYVTKTYADEANREQNAKITEEKQRNDRQDTKMLNMENDMKNFVRKIQGYGLSQEDFSTEIKNDIFRRLELLESKLV